MDFLNALQRFLMQKEFCRIQDDTRYLYLKEEEREFFLIEIIPERLRGQRRKAFDVYEKEIEQLEWQLMTKYQKRVQHLFLVIRSEGADQEDLQEISECENIWVIGSKSGQLYVYENQRAEYCGIRNALEMFCRNYSRGKKKEEKREVQRMFTRVNTILVVVNVLVFLLLCLSGDPEDADFMAEHGAMTWEAIVGKGEFYRMFTSLFLHFGADHLLQNMIVLLVMGCRLERITGSLGYLFIYLASGLTASTASLAFTLSDNMNTVAAGASGAIFGVIGGVLFFILADVVQKRKSRVEEIGLIGIIFMIASTLSYGFFTVGVDNAAHVGGLIGGFVVTGIICLFRHLLEKGKKKPRTR